MKKNSWYMTLMGYYIMILIVPFSVIMILCFLGTYLVKSEIITANQIIVRQFQSEVDSKLKEFQRCNVYVQQEEKLVDIDFSEGRMDAKQIFDIVQVNEQLSKVILADSLIQDYMIYLPDQLMIHSGGYYYLDRFYSFWDEQLLAEIPDYRRILKQNYNSRIFTTYDESGIKNIYYFDTMKGSFFKNKGYQFILKLDTMEWDRMVGQVIDNSDFSYISIVDRETGTPLYVSDKAFYETLKEQEVLYHNKYFSVDSHNDYYCYTDFSEITGLQYILVMDSAHISKPTNWINLLILVCVALLIISTILVFRMLRMREYNSIATTMALLGEEQLQVNQPNIFGAVQEIVTKLLRDRESLQNSLESSEAYLQQYFLVRLLTQNIEDKDAYTNLLEDYHVTFPFPNSRIMLFNQMIPSEAAHRAEQYETMRARIKQYMETVYKDHMVIYPFVYKGMLILVLNHDTFSIEDDQMIDHLYAFNKMLQKESMICTLSKQKESYFQLRMAYNETLEAMEQCLLENVNFKEYHEYHGSQNKKYSKYYQYEENFRNALSENNYKNAEVILNNLFLILKESFSNNTLEIKCKLYCILDSIMRELAEDAEHNEYINDIYSSLKNEQSIKELKRVIVNVMRILAESDCEICANDFSSEVEKYIEAHFCSDSLSVGMIADEFGMEVTTLSKRFKKERGVNISNYIHLLRLKKAKEMLEDKNYTIKVIAEECGYINSDVFIRVFKRYEGITPGKYRSSFCPTISDRGGGVDKKDEKPEK